MVSVQLVEQDNGPNSQKRFVDKPKFMCVINYDAFRCVSNQGSDEPVLGLKRVDKPPL